MSSLTRTGLALGALALAIAPAALSAQSELEKLSIHGYLTQGYGESSKLPYAGLPTDPTGDYRTAALQFRYSITDNDNVVVQLRHRRMGTSPIMTGESDVTLNWAFYQRDFKTLRLKGGKLPLPKGIFNETRAVGTILPFYRAPYNFYAEGFETIDGASVSNTFDLKKLGTFEASAFGGGAGVRVAYTAPNGVTSVVSSRLEQMRGAQLWYNTPVSGLRVGLGGYRWRSRKATDTSTTPTMSSWQASVDGNFSRIQLRGEFSNTSTTDAHVISYYAQGGVRLTEKLSLNVQNDIGDRSAKTPGTTTWRYWRNVRDFAAGASYQWSPNLALKLEQHDVKGFGYDAPIAPTAAPGKSKYLVASVSTAF